MISFDEFLSILGRYTGPALQSQAEWVKQPTDNPYFVPPNLEQETSGGPDSPIILVSAPGAVGKTTFADAVANSQGSPVFDLSTRRVGNDTFTGLIGNAFGHENFSDVYTRLKTGEFLIVIDALDEARVSSGQENFIAFLEGLASHFKGHESTPSVVLLARVDTAELVEIALSLHNVSYQRFTLALFDEDKAREFVDQYLDARYDEARRGRVHRGQRERFEEVRDRLFRLIKGATPTEEAIQLIGYAPVLVALGAYLYEEENYQRLKSLLDQMGSVEGWDLLAALANKLLEREQNEKFLPQLSHELVSHVPNALSPDEQCLWLLLEHVGMQPQLSIPSSVPKEFLSAYERAVETKMTEHPFRRDKGRFQHGVFREYVLGWYLARFRTVQENLRTDIRQRLLARNDLLPSPLLGKFALGWGRNAFGEEQTPLMAGEDIGFLYESFLAQADKNRKTWLQVDSIDGTTALQGRIGVGNDRLYTEEFQIEVSSAGLWFWRHLANADIYVSTKVELGVQGGDFNLGPDVDIECEDFGCPVRQLYVSAETENQAVVIDSRSCTVLSQPKIKIDGSFFFVRWPPLAFPWIRYKLKEKELDTDSPGLQDAYTRLARILKRLRARGYGEVARHRDIVENIAGGTLTGKAILEYCVDQGLIRAKGNLFVLDDARVAAFGINWGDLRLLRLNDRTRDFLVEFLRRPAQ